MNLWENMYAERTYNAIAFKGTGRQLLRRIVAILVDINWKHLSIKLGLAGGYCDFGGP